MSNVVQFPRQPSMVQAQALEYLAQQMRMNLAVACANLQGQPGQGNLCEALDRITHTANLVSEYNAILVACGK